MIDECLTERFVFRVGLAASQLTFTERDCVGGSKGDGLSRSPLSSCYGVNSGRLRISRLSGGYRRFGARERCGREPVVQTWSAEICKRAELDKK